MMCTHKWNSQVPIKNEALLKTVELHIDNKVMRQEQEANYIVIFTFFLNFLKSGISIINIFFGYIHILKNYLKINI